MNSIPAKLEAAFLEELEIRAVPVGERAEWRKWARYYVDFSLKYGHSPRDAATLTPFLEKLEAKNQGAELRADAERSVDLLRRVMMRFPVSPPRGVIAPKPRSEEVMEADRSSGAGMEARGREGAEREVDRARRSGEIGESAVSKERAFSRGGASWERQYQQLGDVLAVGQYALATRKTYTHWIRQFQSYVGSVESAVLDSSHAAEFLTYLAREKQVGASTQNQAFNALLFFFKRVLDREFKPDGVKRAKRTKSVPQTLTREEIDDVIAGMPSPYDLLTKLLYGCGLRLAEALNLRVHNFDFEVRVLTVHRGKGQKDRTVPLPEVLIGELRSHLSEVRMVYEADTAAGFGGAFMPLRGSPKKWAQRATQWQWQFFFPASRLTKVGDGGELRRYHLHANRFSELLRKAVLALGTHKRVSAHTFRHSFASHLLMANYDIKTIQEMLGHSDVRTTMIYVQTVPSRTKKERRSPLDFPAGGAD